VFLAHLNLPVIKNENLTDRKRPLLLSYYRNGLVLSCAVWRRYPMSISAYPFTRYLALEVNDREKIY